MSDNGETDEMEEGEIGQLEQMLVETGMLVHSLANLLVEKGILRQEEIDSEMDRLYDAMEDFGADEDEE